MNIQSQALEQSIKEYKSIQEKHITEFETELIPDLESQIFQRAHAFAEMKNNFDDLLNKLNKNNTEVKSNLYKTPINSFTNTSSNICQNSQFDEPNGTNSDLLHSGYVETVASYISQIKEILKVDSILKEKILIYQKELKQRLNDTGKFKTAFNGYAAAMNTDRHVSIKLTS